MSAIFAVGDPVRALVGTEDGTDMVAGTVAATTPIEGGRQMVRVKLRTGGEVQYANHTGYVVKESA